MILVSIIFVSDTFSFCVVSAVAVRASLAGPFVDWISLPFQTAVKSYISVATTLGCCASGPACDTTSNSVLACMRSQSAANLTAAGASLTWRPTVDGYVFPHHVLQGLIRLQDMS